MRAREIEAKEEKLRESLERKRCKDEAHEWALYELQDATYGVCLQCGHFYRKHVEEGRFS